MQFSYQVLDRQGKRQAGVLTAESQALAVAELRARGYFPLAVEMVSPGTEVKVRRGTVRGEALALFALLLADLLRCLPMDRALAVLARQATHPGVRAATEAALREVEAGQNLATALANQGFPSLFTRMVEAGEQSGQLETVLTYLSAYLRQEEERRGQTRAALIYPLFLLGAALTALLFLLFFLVPRLSLLFGDLGQSLPWSTRFLIGLGEVLARGWPILLPVGIVLAGGLLAWSRSEKGRGTLAEIGLRLPRIGVALQQRLTARLARTLAILLRGGVPLLNCFPLLATLVEQPRLRAQLVQAREEVREGKPLATALGRGILPPMALEMLAVGEESGNLEAMLEQIASTYEFQADLEARRLLSLLEPVIILGMGIVLAFIVSSILLPLFELNAGTGI